MAGGCRLIRDGSALSNGIRRQASPLILLPTGNIRCRAKLMRGCAGANPNGEAPNGQASVRDGAFVAWIEPAARVFLPVVPQIKILYEENVGPSPAGSAGDGHFFDAQGRQSKAAMRFPPQQTIVRSNS